MFLKISHKAKPKYGATNQAEHCSIYACSNLQTYFTKLTITIIIDWLIVIIQVPKVREYFKTYHNCD